MGPAIAEGVDVRRTLEERLNDAEARHAADGWHIAAAYSLALPDGGTRALDAATLYQASGYEVVLKSAPGSLATLRVIVRPLSLSLTPRALAELDEQREIAPDAADEGAGAIARQDAAEVEGGA